MGNFFHKVIKVLHFLNKNADLVVLELEIPFKT